MIRRPFSLLLLVTVLAALIGCQGGGEAQPEPVVQSDPMPRGLLVALAQFEVGPDGKVLPKPKDARLEMLVNRGKGWEVEAIEDGDSNVFHKAMVYDPGTGGPGILTVGGTGAYVKLWRKGGEGFEAETLWTEDFGGKWSRMREAEAGDILGDGRNVLAVVTHDQGVVALLAPKDGEWEVMRLDAEADTIVHEVELGDLDNDGVIEVYATPSEPNKMDGTPQPGKVVRYVPAKGEGRTVVADLGMRHAKEILVADVDADGTDELYVSIEAVEGGSLEIRRYDAGTDPARGLLIATLDDQLCRFLTPGDLDGDGKQEIVAAAYKSGLWLLKPESDPTLPWAVSSIDRASSGFEHAAIVTDLDEDGRDELYVASDNDGEIRRYDYEDGEFNRQTIHKREVPKSVFTWNLMPVDVGLID
jgi:hypothetical protein